MTSVGTGCFTDSFCLIILQVLILFLYAKMIFCACLGFQGVSKHVFMQVAAEEKVSLTCSICGKHFNSQNAQQDHLRSKKHKENEAKQLKNNLQNKNKKIETVSAR